MSSPPPATDVVDESNKDADVELDLDTEMADTQETAPNDNVGTSSATLENEFAQPEAQMANALPHLNRKDVTLREFLSKMDDYAPIIPDAVTAHYLTMAGLPPPSAADPTGAATNTTPLPLARLLALATQKFVADIASDAYQFSRIRVSNSASANNPLSTAAMPNQGLQAVVAGGSGGGKAAQSTQLGVQRSGYGGGGQGGSGQGRTVLTMEDLGMAMQEYGVNVKRGEFYR